jgi:L-threonylcarbamoyladenylate synthase
MQRKSLKVVSESSPSSLPLAVSALLRNEPVVAPTDTIYGILALATSFSAVEKLRKIRRPSGKPFIVLCPDLPWVRKLGLTLTRSEERALLKGVTVVLRKKGGLYYFLGTSTVAVRIPSGGFIGRLLKRLGRPVVAPSANPEGEPPAEDVDRAVNYFGDRVELYVDGGVRSGGPSPILKLFGKVEIIRRGRLSYRSLTRFTEMLSQQPCPG